MQILPYFTKRLSGMIEILIAIVVFSSICIAAPPSQEPLIFTNDFEPNKPEGTTRVAVSRVIGGQTHVGWVDIDTGVWFDMTGYLNQTYNDSGDDKWLAISNDLSYYILETERAGYNGWSGLTWGTLNSNGEPSQPKAVEGDPHPEGHGSISKDGAHIAVTLRNGNNDDIFLLTRKGAGWDRAQDINLSVASTGRNEEPQFSVNGSKIIWTNYANGEMSFDENNLTGNGYTRLLGSDRLGSSAKMLRPSYEANGKIVFEGELDGELCYRWDPTAPGSDPAIIDHNYSNDNSCGALPDGRIVSYWMGRQGSGGHELRVMLANGTHQSVLQKGIDFWDLPVSGGTAR